MFERLKTPQEAFSFQLGATLNMERTVQKSLESKIDNAQDERVADLFRRHHGETSTHVSDVERVFELFGWEPDDSKSPGIEALAKEGASNAKKTDDAIVDSVLLQSAIEVEHHEIAVYENLIINARAMGRDDVGQVLERTQRAEEQMLRDVTSLLVEVVAVTPKQSA